MAKRKLALLLVYHKEGLEDFAAGLVEIGFDLVSSGGTAEYLREHGFNVTEVSKITSYPAFLGDLAVTLHPLIQSIILSKKIPEHEQELEAYGMERFQLVCGDLYPVIEMIAQANGNIDKVMDQTDIGGPTLIRGAAKNHESVIVICDSDDRSWVLNKLKYEGDLGLADRRKLAKKVFATTSAYDAAIRDFLTEQNSKVVDTLS